MAVNTSRYSMNSIVLSASTATAKRGQQPMPTTLKASEAITQISRLCHSAGITMLTYMQHHDAPSIAVISWTKSNSWRGL